MFINLAKSNETSVHHPPRGGSKRIPNKGLRNFCGQPMIAHIISAASSSSLFDKIHVSTGCHQIAKTASRLGCKVDFLRPTQLADDHTTIITLLKYVLEVHLVRGVEIDCVVSITACTPTTAANDLCHAAVLFDANYGKQAVLGVAEYSCPVEWVFRLESNGVQVPMQSEMFSIRSQSLASGYYNDGQFSFMPSERLLASVGTSSDEGFLGYKIKRHQAIEIDTLEDWRFVELAFSSLSQHTEQS